MQNKLRPKFLNLFILAPKMPITAKVSILHRITGLLLFLAIPLLPYLLHQSLISTSFYNVFYATMASPVIKIIYLIMIFAFTYHLCAGIRFILLDMHKGVHIQKARRTAYATIIISLVITFILGALIW